MGVDFVKSDSGTNRSKANGKSTGYPIEYSDAITEPDEVKPKLGGLLGTLMGNATSGRIPMPSTTVKKSINLSSAQSAQVATTSIARSAEYKPLTTQATSNTTARPVSTTPVTPAPVTARLTERHLPPPPPPPVHSSAPVAPVVTAPRPVEAMHEFPLQPKRQTLPVEQQPIQKPVVAPQAPVPTVTPIMAPAVSKPVPATIAAPRILPQAPPAPSHTAPVQAIPTQATIAAAPAKPMAPVKTSVAASAPMAVGHQATSVGEVVAKNVTGMRGETTHPEPLAPQLVGVNLLPNAIQQPLQQQMPLYRLLRTSAVIMMLFTLGYLGMVGYQAFFIWRTQAALSELTDLDSQILTYRALQHDINTTSSTLDAIQDLLTKHIYWSQWFSYLEQHTLPTVYYSGFSGSANGTMNLQAIAPDFTTISQQIAALRALPEVTAVTVSTATRSEANFAETTGDTTNLTSGTVQFTISLQVDPSILHYQPNGLYEQSR